MGTRGGASIAVVGCAGALLLGACGSGSPASQPVLFAHLQVSPTFQTYHVANEPQVPGVVASIVADSAGQLYVSDYGHVYLLTHTGAGYAFTALIPPPSLSGWRPTGLAYRNGLLYVANANDSGHDVLVFRLNGSALLLERRITSTSLRTPQSVAVEQDGSLVVADDKAGAVVRFGADGGQLWRTGFDRARAVAVSNGVIYAASADDKVIVRISMSGAIQKTTGAAGVSLGRYQLPVGLAARPNGGVVLTDANNGRISVLDQNLRVVKQVGANGAGIDAFNQPYATVPVGDGYVIADTFKYRIVHTDARWLIQDQVVFASMVPSGRGRPLVFGNDARPVTYPMLPGVDLAAELGLRPPLSFVGGFNGLDQVADSSKNAVHLIAEDPQLGPMSQTWAQRVGQYDVIGSPTNDLLEVIDPATGMYSYVSVGKDAWWRAEGVVLLPGGLRSSLDQVIRPATQVFARAAQQLAQGTSRRDVLDHVLGGNQAAGKDQPRNLSADFTTQAGKQFASSKMTRDDATRYYDAVRASKEQRIIELVEVKFLSGS